MFDLPPVPDLAQGPPAVVEVMHDSGGALGERYAVVSWLKRHGVQVRIVGTCASACNLLLTLPPKQLCIEPGAWFGQHSLNDWNKIEWKRGRDLIASGYRACIK